MNTEVKGEIKVIDTIETAMNKNGNLEDLGTFNEANPNKNQNKESFNINFFKKDDKEDNLIYPKIGSVISKSITVKIVFIILVLVLFFNILVVELFIQRSYSVKFELLSSNKIKMRL